MRRDEYFVIARETVREFTKDDVGLLAAGLTYYVFFGIFPLLLLSVLILGVFFNPTDVQTFIFFNVAQAAPGSVKFLETALDAAIKARNNAGWLAVIGVVTLTYSASNAFGTLDKAINRAWDTEKVPNLVVSKLISFAMMGSVAVLLLISVLISTAISTAQAFTSQYIGKIPGSDIFWQGINGVGSLVLVFLVLLFMYRLVPRTEVRFADVWLPALIGSIAWVVMKEAFSIFLGTSFANYDAVYGTVGAVIALLTWIYISSVIILAGAEFGSETCRFRRLSSTPVATQLSGSEQSEQSERVPESPFFQP